MAGVIGVVATRGHATEIHPEAMLTFRTIDTVTIATDRSGDAFRPVQQQDYRSQVQPRQSAVAPAPYYYGGYYGAYPYPTTIRTFTTPTFTGQALGSTMEAVSAAIAAADFAAVGRLSEAAVVARGGGGGSRGGGGHGGGRR